jgi:cytochrome c oxidase cbb3-type subunit 2
MNSGPLLFFGIFLTLASSFWGFLLMPQMKMGNQQVTEIAETGQLYPVGHTGLAGQGAEVYRSLGCVECHTRQVRPRNLGGDIARGWGNRRSVAQDYLKDYPVLLGHLRVGPDLANAGLRHTNETELLKLIYKPQSVNMGGMPAYPFLFKRNHLKQGQQPSADALKVEGEPADLEIIPNDNARALVAYLMSLRSDVSLYEAPLPPKPKPAGGDTNVAPTSVTNAQPAGGAPAASAPAPSANPAK